jgi:spermidine/putrescine-binding protein
VDQSLLDEASPLTCIDTDVLMIPRGAKHPEASMEFIAFTQRRENVEALASAHCKGSPLASVSEEFLESHANRGVRLHTSMAGSPRAFIAPTTPNWPQYKDLLDTAFQDMWKLEAQPAARLGLVEQRANEILATAREHRRMRGDIS